jgi:acetate kinase
MMCACSIPRQPSSRRPELAVLIVNAGSTSLKLSAVADDGSAELVDSLAALPAGIEAVGHRVVHGGVRFREPVVIDDQVERQLAELTELAPLHQGPALRALADARNALPDVPHVAVFDTAFHATLPEVASTYALPRRWRDGWGIRRYGFHGLSVQWAAEQVRVRRLVVCHLGGGCSVTAVHAGRSVDTTMGFTPREGVPMATRSGSVDPGALSHVLRAGRLSAEELDHELEHASGLLGLSGLSGNVEELESSAEPLARLALGVFSYRIAGAVASMAAALGGIDALVFTAGIGEHSARVRADVCARLGFLGVALDEDANRTAGPDAEIAAAGSRVRLVVVRAREDLVAARAVRGLLGLRTSGR